MSNKLAAIREKLAAKENNKGGQTRTYDNAAYPFWNIPFDSMAQIRFLPDGDESNDYFWVERQTINLPFTGIVGGDMTKEVNVTVPCLDMYGEACPIMAETRPWWKDDDLKDLARKYWKKRTYIFQGFVVNSPLKEETTPENPIRRFAINKSVAEIIETALKDPDIEDMPTDYDLGLDFQLKKTKKGEYANYSTSQFARKTRSLTADERAAIDQYGLFNLKDFLPKKPTADDLKIIMEMFHASVNGEPYDEARWGNHYRPNGLRMSDKQEGNTGSTTSTDTAPKAESAPWEAPAEEVTPVTAASPSSNAQDIMARIRARQQA